MQAGNALDEQPLGHGHREVDADPPTRWPTTHCFQPPGQVLRERGPAQLGEPGDLPGVRGRHNRGDDRDVAPRHHDPVSQPQVVLGPEEHLGDRVVRARTALGHEVSDVGLPVGGARMALGERGHADAERSRFPHQPDQLPGAGEAVRVRDPGRVRVARRVTPQGQENVPDAGVRVLADDVPQFGDRVRHRRQVGHGAWCGLRRDPLRQLDRAVPGRPPRPRR